MDERQRKAPVEVDLCPEISDKLKDKPGSAEHGSIERTDVTQIFQAIIEKVEHPRHHRTALLFKTHANSASPLQFGYSE